MKIRWNVKAKNASDDVWRIHYNALPFIRALVATIRYMNKYDEVLIKRSTIYG